MRICAEEGSGRRTQKRYGEGTEERRACAGAARCPAWAGGVEMVDLAIMKTRDRRQMERDMERGRRGENELS